MGFTHLVERASSPGFMVSQGTMIALMWLGVALSTGFVALRTYIQYNKTKRFFANDYFIFIALILQITSAILYQFAIPPMYQLLSVGLGFLAPPPTFVEDAAYFLKLQFAVLFTMWPTLWAAKFSLLFFYWRLFDSVQSPMRILWWVMTLVTASTLVVAFALQCQSCQPLSNYFVLGGCAKPRDLFYSNLVFRFVVGTDIAGDILIMIIPFPLLWKLRMNAQQKYILIGIFLLPILPIIFAVLRLVKANATTGNVDPVAFQVYSMLENTTAIITACLPSLRLFVNRTQVHTQPSQNYSNGISSTSTHDAFRRGRKGSIPLDTFVEADHGDIVEDTAGILVKQAFYVESKHGQR